jgi:hypothetical protein
VVALGSLADFDTLRPLGSPPRRLQRIHQYVRGDDSLNGDACQGFGVRRELGPGFRLKRPSAGGHRRAGGRNSWPAPAWQYPGLLEGRQERAHIGQAWRRARSMCPLGPVTAIRESHHGRSGRLHPCAARRTRRRGRPSARGHIYALSLCYPGDMRLACSRVLKS